MDLHIDMELNDGLLLVTASGNLIFNAALRLFKQIFDTAEEKEVNKILLNSLAVDGQLSEIERYTLAVELLAYLKQCQMKPRLAIVGKPPATTGFGALIAQN